METGRNVFRMGNPDGSGQARVERGRPFVRRNAVGIQSVCMKNLAQSMNAGVCPAGTVDTAGGSKESGKGSFQHVLDGTASRLALPAQIRASVICGGETNAGHRGDCVGTARFWQAASAGR